MGVSTISWSQALHKERLGTRLQDIVARKIPVNDVVGVKVGQGECHIMTDVELSVVREGTSGPL